MSNDDLTENLLGMAQAAYDEEQALEIAAKAKQKRIQHSSRIESKDLPASVLLPNGVTAIILNSPDYGCPRPVKFARTTAA